MNKNIIKINFKELQIYTYSKTVIITPKHKKSLCPTEIFVLNWGHAPLYKNSLQLLPHYWEEGCCGMSKKP